MGTGWDGVLVVVRGWENQLHGEGEQQASRRNCEEEDMTLNSDIPWPSIDDAKQRVLCMQKKLHQWTKADSERKFDDLYNLVYDRATLIVAWERIKSNAGSKTAGVDGVTRWSVEHRMGINRFLEEIRLSMKERTYKPLPVREHGIPKANGKTRYLGIPTICDRVVQMALKLMMEPIFEVDFYPSSYGYRPKRRAHDAIAEIATFINPRSQYEYVIEGDIKACFDNVNHGVLLTQVRKRIMDRKVLGLIKAFLKSGVMKEGNRFASTLTGTPQGGIISPLLANIYMSVLDSHFEHAWKYQTRYIGASTYYRRRGYATYRLVRYADDFVILLRGSREQAQAIRDEAARVLKNELKMELSAEKTLITHVDEGFNFLGHHVRRVLWNGTRVAWTYPSKKSLSAIKTKVREITDRSTMNLDLKRLLIRLNSVLKGWAAYFRYDASKRTFAYVDNFAWWRIWRWLREKHANRTVKYIRTRYCGGKWDFQEGDVEYFRIHKVHVERYRYRGTRILLPWMNPEEFGKVGRYASSKYDDPTFLGSLEEALS
jgi:RNA-directed DNA polymerase